MRDLRVVRLYGPKGMPSDVTARIHQEAARMVKQPDMNERLGQFGAEPIASTPQSNTPTI